MRLDPLARIMVNEARMRRLTYDQFNKIARQARQELGLKPPRGPRRLPQILPAAGLERFYEIIDKADNLQHALLLRLLFYTAVRVSELCGMEVRHVDFGESKIFIDQGKGSRDRYVLYPEWFGMALRTHLAAHPDNRYLFESNRRTRYSERMIEKIVKKYALLADLSVHPHLLRHQMLTFLTAEGKLTDAQIQLISGHASKKSLEVYQHVGLESVSADYQEALRKLNI